MAEEIQKEIWPEWQIIGGPIGRGSFGEVYKVVRREYSFESYAALKVIKIPQNEAEIASLQSEGLSEGSAREYLQGVVMDFVREIQIMESLKAMHNIVCVEDYTVIEKSDGIGWTIYIRMELLTPFVTYTRDHVMSEAEVIKLGMDLCTALELCERRHIIHRDIKPENIFLNEFGDFKLGDFGIARKLENVTSGLSQKGTYNYMAPEVERGDNYDGRVDIYSLGLVLYRLLNNNHLPFLETEQQLMNPNERVRALRRRLNGEPLNRPCDASPAMAEVILKACAFRPSDRYASATELKHALISVANGTYRSQHSNSADRDATIAVRRPIKDGQNRTNFFDDDHSGQNRTENDYREVKKRIPKESRKGVRGLAITASAVCAVVVFAVLLKMVIIPNYGDNHKYNEALDLFNAGQYEEAITAFEEMEGYKDSLDQIENCKTAIKDEQYNAAAALYAAGKYTEAVAAFEAMNGYRDSDAQIENCNTETSKFTLIETRLN